MSIPLTQRDLRIDLVRGFALLVLVTDHLPGNPIRPFMPVSWGLADMAEAFVLLSGVVAGYGITKQRMVLECTTHRLRRAATLYVAYLITGLLLVAMVRLFHIGIVAETLPAHLLSGSWFELFIDLVSLNGRVTHLCILLLYFWIAFGMICLPDRAWKFPIVIFSISFLLYVGSQLSIAVSLPEQQQKATYFNPFAWQFLFVTGAVYATSADRWRNKKISRAVIFPLALIIQGCLLFSLGLEVSLPEFLISKKTLGPLRYLHSISAALILSQILPKKFSPGWKQLLKPFFRCSEQSLWVYCGGTLIVVGVSPFMWQAESLPRVIFLNVLTWTGCYLIAWMAARLKHWLSMRQQLTS